MFDRFTDSARRVLVLAQEEARLLDHHFLGTEHILLGLIRNEDITSRVLTELGASLTAVRERVAETIGPTAPAWSGSPPFTPRTKKVLELSVREARELSAGYVDAAHILLGLVQEGHGVGAQVLVGIGVDLTEVRTRVIRGLVGGTGESGLGSSGVASSSEAASTPHARVVACSFCGLSPPETGQLVAGSGAFICEHCVSHWATRLRPGSPLRLPRSGWISRASVDLPSEWEPDGADGARARIKDAFAASRTPSEDGRSVPAVAKGDGLGPTLAAANERHRDMVGDGSKLSISADEIHFYDTTRAAVWFSIALGERTLLRRHRGEAVLVDGEWKMARTTFCQLMGMAGVVCPPEEE